MAKARVTNSDIMAVVLPLQQEISKARIAVENLTVQVKGNGGKGVLQRLNEVEKDVEDGKRWQTARPVVCPATSKEVTKRVMAIVVAVAGGLTVLSMVVNLFLKPFGYRNLEQELKRATPALEQIEKFQKMLENVEKVTP